MSNLIKLLPDTVANQIAAGEVVQRPASVVKELLENAIDAGATDIKLVVKDAGKALIQVIDNGVGMSETDARLCFERHATSKIKNTEDLFHIKTKGFRGEALASIAAVAQVELKTKMHNSEVGTHIIIEGNKLVKQEICQCPAGTNFTVKNLFFNVPARRKFLKSSKVELMHIEDEFKRVALAHPDIAFSFYNNEEERYILPVGNFKQRIVQVFGKKFQERLIAVKEDTDVVKIAGFIGKPEFSKKKRDEQFFFVNNRFIKSGYLHHAVMKAYDELIPEGNYPAYFIKLEIEPEKIDINIHPTKTEIKFDDEQVIYHILRTAVRQAIGQHQLTPMLDFEQETSFDIPLPKKGEPVKIPQISVNTSYNPFNKEKTKNTENKNANKYDWQSFFENTKQDASEILDSQNNNQQILFDEDEVNVTNASNDYPYIQLGNYLITRRKSGLLFIHIKRAYQNIIFHNLLEKLQNQTIAKQQLAFPETYDISPSETSLIEDIIPDLNALGFDISLFGKNTFIVHAVPAVSTKINLQYDIKELIDDFTQSKELANESKLEKIAWTIAKTSHLNIEKQLAPQEVNFIIDTLFACQHPTYLPDGKKVIENYSINELEKLFN
jgi:DNA mismatch repair protein MutL